MDKLLNSDSSRHKGIYIKNDVDKRYIHMEFSMVTPFAVCYRCSDF